MKTIKKIMMMVYSAMCCASLFATTRYVVPSESGYDALTPRYTSIAAALDAAAANDTILVCKGTYSITASYTLSRTKHAGVTIRSYDPDNGGKINRDETIFDGAGILSGDGISRDGIFNCTGIGGEVGIVFDGLTFRKSPVGALRFIAAAGMKILNCNFYTNTVDTTTASEANMHGGAILDLRCDGTLVSNCVFVANKATASGGMGGAIYHTYRTDDESSRAIVVNCIFKDNASEQSSGGAIYVTKRVDIRKCDFDGNKANTSGGSVYMVAYSLVSDCTFRGTAGGAITAIAVFGSSGEENTISGCTFSDMVVSGTEKRGLVSGTKSNLLIENCIFRNASNVKGYICAYENNPNPITVRNCLFADGAAGVNVLYMNNSSDGKVTLENCTVYAPGRTVVRYDSGSSSAEWKNCILDCTTPTTSGSNVQTVTDCYTGTNPSFVCADEGVFRLRSDSPCIDQSEALAWYDGATDLAGNPRVVGAQADYGCYERQPDDKDFVDTTRLVATAEEKTGDWADAYTDFQAAIDATPDRYRLLVKPGLYRPAGTLVISNRFIEIVSCGEDGVPDPANTIVDGQNARRVMLVHWGETKTASQDQNPVNWRQVRIEGLTFTNGVTAAEDGQPFSGNGGGLLFYGRAPSSDYAPSRVVNCRFGDCSAVNGGGAALFGGWLEDCTFTACTATYGGGACGIEPNVSAAKATDYTTAHAWYSASLIGCAFSGNVASMSGGGYACGTDTNGRHAYVENCSFTSNRIERGSTRAYSCSGSGLAFPYGSLVAKCTFTGNTGGAYGALRAMPYTHGEDLCFSGNSAEGCGSLSANSGETQFDRCQIVEDPGHPTIGIFGCGTYRNCLVVNGSGKSCIMQNSSTVPLILENCTLVNKSGVVMDFHSSAAQDRLVELSNCILWRADGNPVHAIKSSYNATYATNCCFSCAVDAAYGFHLNPGCFVNARPGFVDVDNGDWSLRGSACRDKGVMLGWMTADAIDLAGNPRVFGDNPDLGCYECIAKYPGFTLVFR